MTAPSIAHIRLVNQQLTGTEFKTPKEIVTWMGAMQAQDFNMAKWAIGMRIGNITDRMVEDALNKGEIIRTHVLRPTWHFVSADDIYWMLALTGPRIKPTIEGYSKYLEMESVDTLKIQSFIFKALEGGNHLTREELCKALEQAGMKADIRQVNHIMSYAEIDGIVGSGRVKGKKQTYCLLEEIIPRPKDFDRDNALEQLARRYFMSHAPATLQDFVWWSGLTLTDSRKAIEMIRNDFVIEKVEGQEFVFSNSPDMPCDVGNRVHLLPAFDEYVVSYKDRKAIFAHGFYLEVIGKIGLFKATVMYDGQVIGMWKRTLKNKKHTITPEYFIKINKDIQKAVDVEIQKYERFMS